MSVETAQQPPVADAIAEKVEDLSLDDKVTKTVLRSTEDFTVTHPLTSKWTLWYTKPSTGKEDWHSLLKEVVTVTSVEEFWGVYNSIPKVTDLQLKSDYSFFKKGIRPEWEDVANQKGGKWVFQFKEAKSRNSGKVTVDEAWLRVLLGIIGGTLDNDKEIITGAFVNVRKAAIRVNLWTTTTDRDQLRKVGERFKVLLGLSDHDEIEFSSHEDSAASGRPSRHSKFII